MTLFTDEQRAQMIDHLRAAVAWLDSEQDADAIMTHHGIYLRDPLVDSLSISLAPVAAEYRPVLIFTRRTRLAFTKAEVEELWAMVESVCPIFDWWNGAGTDTVSFSLNRFAGPGVAHLISNYRALGSRVFDPTPEDRLNYGKATKPKGWYA